MNHTARIVFSTLLFASASAVSHADVVFSDDFESGLNLWTGKSNGAHHGVITTNPLGGLGSVLTFDGLNSAGDMFTNEFELESNQSYLFSFDYLGLAQERSNATNTGGYIGFSVGTPSTHRWMWATGTESGANDVLIDDGQWHSYDFEFTTADLGIGSTVRLMLEDFTGSAGISGDAYFDNFRVTTIPSPSTAAFLGLGGILALRRRR